jgi:apolipoprotein N-acyltransferase
VVATYDKFHLVPFGEYMPLRGVLPVAAIAAGAVDFSAGSGPASLDLPGLPPVSPLICYEVIFPAAVKDPGQRPDWLLNLTNDAWYGISAGPHQHFAIARVRAVEEGLPLVRAANTGISGVVDAYGRIVGQLALGVRGVVDAPLPASLPTTPYGRFGDTIFVVMLISFALATTWARQTPPKSHIF